MPNQTKVLRPLATTVYGPGTAAPTAGWLVVGNTAGTSTTPTTPSDSVYMAPWNKMTDAGAMAASLFAGYGTGGTNYRADGGGRAGANATYATVLANRKTMADAVLNATTTITSATGRFTSHDIGATIISSAGVGTGAGQIPANTTIVAVNSATSIQVSAITGTGGTPVLTIGDTSSATVGFVGDYVAMLWDPSTTQSTQFFYVSFGGLSLPNGADVNGVHTEIGLVAILDTAAPNIEGSLNAKAESLYIQPYSQTSSSDHVSGMTTTVYTSSNFPVATGAAGAIGWAVSNTGTGFVSGGSAWPLTVARINDLNVYVHVKLASANPEVRFFAMYLYVDYNQRPSALASLSVGNTPTPTISWTYTDPEGDTQQRYRILVFTQAQASTVGFDINACVATPTSVPSPTPAYDSGEIVSSATSFQIPAGALKPGVPYRVFTLVTDRAGKSFTGGGSTNHYGLIQNTVNVDGTGGLIAAGSANGAQTTDATGQLQTKGLDFTPSAEPILTPWVGTALPNTSNFANLLNAGTGVVGPILGHGRMNLLSFGDSSFENSDGTTSVGDWTATAGALTSVNTGGKVFRGSWVGKLVPSVNGLQSFITSGAVAVAPGIMYTASAKISQDAANASIARRSCLISIAWYSDAAGTTLIGTQWANGATMNMQAVGSAWQTVYVQAVAPANALSAKVIVTGSLSPGPTMTDIYYIDCVSFTPYCINLCDDASMQIGAPSATNSYWSSTLAGGNVINWVSDGFNDTYWQANNGQRANVNNIGFCYELVSNGANNCILTQNSDVGVTGGKYVLTGYAKYMGTTGTGQLTVGLVTSGAGAGSTFTSTITGFAPGVWTRWSAILDLSAQANTQNYKISINASAAAQTIRVDGVSLLHIWALQHGTFDDYGPSSAATVNAQTIVNPTVGFPPNLSSTAAEGQDWQADITVGGASTVTYSTATATGGSGRWAQLSAAVNETCSVFQTITVEGSTTISVNSLVAWSNLLTGSMRIEFFDIGGLPLSGNPVSIATTRTGTNVAFQTNNSGNVNIPTGACYAKLSFWNGGSLNGTSAGLMWVDTVSVTLSGSATLSPFLDGGFSRGGVQQEGATMQLVRANSLLGPWSVVRQGADDLPTSASVPVVASNAFALTWNDYEWPGSSPMASSDLYYLTQVNTVTSVASPFSLALQLEGVIATSEWLLIDPLSVADNVRLNVKPDGVKIETQEMLQAFTPVGRSRKIIIADKVLGDTITLDLITFTQTDYAALQKQLAKQTTLFLQAPDGESWYVRTTKRSRQRTWTGNYTTRSLRTFNITFEQVDTLT